MLGWFLCLIVINQASLVLLPNSWYFIIIHNFIVKLKMFYFMFLYTFLLFACTRGLQFIVLCMYVCTYVCMYVCMCVCVCVCVWCVSVCVCYHIFSNVVHPYVIKGRKDLPMACARLDFS